MEIQKAIAQRTLHWSSKQLLVQVGVPVARYRGTEWHCTVEIRLVPGRRILHERVIGIDGWQSVGLAMEFAQRIIDEQFPDAYLFEPGDGPDFSIIRRRTPSERRNPPRLMGHLDAAATNSAIELNTINSPPDESEHHVAKNFEIGIYKPENIFFFVPLFPRSLFLRSHTANVETQTRRVRLDICQANGSKPLHWKQLDRLNAKASSLSNICCARSEKIVRYRALSCAGPHF
ncbi:MAG TPA: hypothetical protein VFE47_14925 [Tepidisphaeraceae bacterium]|jgi:hypothetical protein|nr:hypothetical protein [Tepidisphaeraceae bacterium]